METVPRICAAIATVALLIGSGAGFSAVRLSRERPYWVWRGGASVGVGALLLGVIVRGVAVEMGSASEWPLLSSVADRAALVALIAGLLSVGPGLWNLTHSEWRSMGWAELIPGAVMAGVSAVGRPTGALATSAPFLLVCTVIAAGLVVWAAGRGLDVLVSDRADNLRAAAVAFVGLTVNVAVVGGANWRVWGTPSGTVAASLGLLAAWLVSAARLVLHGNSVRLTSTLDLIAAAVIVVVALSVEWTWPFG